jgi:hypothetical protein
MMRANTFQSDLKALDSWLLGELVRRLGMSGIPTDEEFAAKVKRRPSGFCSSATHGLTPVYEEIRRIQA